MITAENDTLFFVRFVDKFLQHDDVTLSGHGIPEWGYYVTIACYLSTEVLEYDNCRE